MIRTACYDKGKTEYAFTDFSVGKTGKDLRTESHALLCAFLRYLNEDMASEYELHCAVSRSLIIGHHNIQAMMGVAALSSPRVLELGSGASGDRGVCGLWGQREGVKGEDVRLIVDADVSDKDDEEVESLGASDDGMDMD
jgi:hypothetical protein